MHTHSDLGQISSVETSGKRPVSTMFLCFYVSMEGQSWMLGKGSWDPSLGVRGRSGAGVSL